MSGSAPALQPNGERWTVIVPDTIARHDDKAPAAEYAERYAEKWELPVVILDWKRRRFELILPR